MDRRTLLAGLSAALVARPMLAAAQGQGAPPPQPTPSRAERIGAAARQHRLRLDRSGGAFSGPAWEALLARGREARFFLIGEQHGIAENARLAAVLFQALVPAGYAHVVIETSPPMATAMDAVLRGGLEAYRRFYADPASRTAFFGMREEAEWLTTARAAVPHARPVLWGTDYEVGADRHLIRLLKAKPKPLAAQRALAALESASMASWARYATTREPRHIFSFAGDPALVASLRTAWPHPDAEAQQIMDTLQGTFEINRLWAEQRGWASNARRAALMRANFLDHWRAERAARRRPRVMLKMGAFHMTRGLTPTGVYDLGTLLPELAALEGGTAFQLLVLNGRGTQTAQLDPTSFTYRARPTDDFHAALAPLMDAVFETGFTLFDMAPLKAIARVGAEGLDPDLVRIVHGFDAVLVMTGSTPSANL
ncbi:MAG TPA: hypothetical protein VMG08_01205 [Allosphingosinicella sp.]|nr:hypothetical protein [Allosphingosinicella sp.]